MKKSLTLIFLIIFSCFLLVACNKKEATKTVSEGEKYLSLNEEFIGKKDGKQLFSLKITSLKSTTDLERLQVAVPGVDMEKLNNYQLVEIEYTYKNLEMDELYISQTDLTVRDDKEGVKAQEINDKSISDIVKKGKECKAKAYYVLENKSDNVNIFYDAKELGEAKFKIPATELLKD